jgi:hypothetical protein
VLTEPTTMLAEPKPVLDAREPVETWAAYRVLNRLAFGPDVDKDEYSYVNKPKKSVPVLVSKAVVKLSTNPALTEPATAAAAAIPTIEEVKDLFRI